MVIDMNPNIEINIAETTIIYEIDPESLSAVLTKGEGITDDDSIEDAVEILNSPWSDNSYSFDIKYNEKINHWICERIVWWYDGCSAVLTTYADNHQTAFMMNGILFNRLQAKYNPNSNSF